MSACGGFGRDGGAAVGEIARGEERGRLDIGLAAESQGVRPSFKRNRGMIGCKGIVNTRAKAPGVALHAPEK